MSYDNWIGWLIVLFVPALILIGLANGALPRCEALDTPHGDIVRVETDC